MNQIYLLLILLMTYDFTQGMEEKKAELLPEQEQPFQISSRSETISCKNKPGVVVENLVLKKVVTKLLEHQLTQKDLTELLLKNTLLTPENQMTKSVSAVDITYADNVLYALGRDTHNKKNIFSKKLKLKEALKQASDTKKIPDDQHFIDNKKKPVTRFFYKTPYFFSQFNEEGILEIRTSFNTLVANNIKHNTTILCAGTINANTINEGVFSGSSWPSIKKSYIPKSEQYILKTEPFIDNAYLLACQDNGMIIAKIDEEDNIKFWFWRRFNKKTDVRVTLYVLFFEEKNIQSINKKMIEKALNEAHSQAKTSEKNKNIYEKNNITIITLAKNVVLTPAEQEDPLKKFPKAALIKNTALVIHTQRYPNNKEVFSQNSPAVSIAYRNERAEWHTNQIIFEGKDDLRGWINKKKQIDSDYIRLPDLYEIKDIYITQINNEPLALLITQTKQKGHYCDGVYAIPLTGQTKSDLRQPFWYVDIKTSANSWRAAEKIVASTFDEKNQRLFLITEKPIFTKKQESSPSQGTGTKEIPEQQLVTIDINLALNPKKK